MPGGAFLYVDVRDVADAHILAFENPSATDRYCVVAKTLYAFEALDILRHLYPTLNIPEGSEENTSGTPPYQVSNEKAKSLGVSFIPLQQSLKDTVESFKERNLISFTL
ncbi:UNVERIFIED_CONTAM: Cinnamoyl-CoA reductase 1 [Sesamum radiatum]|uniref:Cinnamoyl-CoA reductase 1 n=1 Tax=Sesamum radiatum TaxID=300843 RepID=A0AAW2U8W6_SESRA